MSEPTVPSRRGRPALPVLALAAALGLASCAPGRDLAVLPDPAAPSSLGPGDLLRVITYGEQTLTGEFRINSGGNIAVPLIGPVRAAGMSTSALEHTLAQELADHQVMKNASVSVEVVSYRPIFVLGEVNKPGEYPYQPGMTMLSAVAVAGGFTYRAWDSYAATTRNTAGKVVQGRVNPGSLLQPGDVVTVLERIF